LRRARERLTSIQAEVSQFHPLLKEVLPRLPHILEYEYTQGPNEKGADFVLRKHDSTLGDDIYVGVVVKVGKITVDLTEIERQIDECKVMPRKFRNGSKQIRLSEVWIISNSTISSNAQDKIHEKFSGTSISFIDGERLAKLISEHAPYCWQDLSPKLAARLESTLAQVAELESQSSLLSESGAQNFYIDLEIVEVMEDFDPKRKRPTIPIIDIPSKETRVSVIQADMGTGKSKIMRQIAKYYADPLTFEDHKFLPLLAPSREVVREFDCDISEYAKERLGEQWEDVEEKKYNVLVLIDGLDEAFSSNTDDGAEIYQKLIDSVEGHDWLKVIIAARPSPILESEAIGHKGVERLEIRPLSLKKIMKFIQTVCTEFNVSDRLIEDVRNSELFKQLPQTPIAAILLSRLLTEDRQDLPAGLTELYAKSVELMLGRWDIQKGLESDKEYRAAVNICGELAVYMLDNDLEAIGVSEAKGFFDRYLLDRNMGINANELFEKVVTRSGVVGIDHRRKVILFRHRSFAEFLYANYHKDHGTTLSVDERYFRVYWITTRFFYVGLLADCPNLLQDILAWTPPGLGDRWMKTLKVPDYLLAAVASPYSITEENLHRLLLDASELYDDLLHSKDKLVGRLSETQLLFIFQALLRHSYSYRFFRKAMESTTLQIAGDISSDDVKKYALFFTALIGRDLGYTEALGFLVKEYDMESLPLAVSSLLRVELKSMKDEEKSPLVRKQLKRVNKLLRDSRALRSQLEQVNSTPLRARNLK
jgi:hypothetical protein